MKTKPEQLAEQYAVFDDEIQRQVPASVEYRVKQGFLRGFIEGERSREGVGSNQEGAIQLFQTIAVRLLNAQGDGVNTDQWLRDTELLTKRLLEASSNFAKGTVNGGA